MDRILASPDYCPSPTTHKLLLEADNSLTSSSSWRMKQSQHQPAPPHTLASPRTRALLQHADSSLDEASAWRKAHLDGTAATPPTLFDNDREEMGEREARDDERKHREERQENDARDAAVRRGGEEGEARDAATAAATATSAAAAPASPQPPHPTIHPPRSRGQSLLAASTSPLPAPLPPSGAAGEHVDGAAVAAADGVDRRPDRGPNVRVNDSPLAPPRAASGAVDAEESFDITASSHSMDENKPPPPPPPPHPPPPPQLHTQRSFGRSPSLVVMGIEAHKMIESLKSISSEYAWPDADNGHRDGKEKKGRSGANGNGHTNDDDHGHDSGGSGGRGGGEVKLVDAGDAAALLTDASDVIAAYRLLRRQFRMHLAKEALRFRDDAAGGRERTRQQHHHSGLEGSP